MNEWMKSVINRDSVEPSIGQIREVASDSSTCANTVNYIYTFSSNDFHFVTTVDAHHVSRNAAKKLIDSVWVGLVAVGLCFTFGKIRCEEAHRSFFYLFYIQPNWMKNCLKGIDSTGELQEVTPYHQRAHCNRHVRSDCDKLSSHCPCPSSVLLAERNKQGNNSALR